MAIAIKDFQAEQDADIRVLMSRLFSKRWWIIGTVFAFAFAAGVAAFLMTPIYRSETVLAPTNAERGAEVSALAASALGGLASGLGLGPKDSETEEALAVLRSREFTQDFISREHLMPKLYSDKWDSIAGTWKASVKKPPTLAKAYKYFNTKIRSITEDRKTGLVTLQIDWKDRKDAAVWANALARQLNDEMRTRAIEESRASTQFLDDELKRTTTVEGRDAISRLLETELRKKMLATVTPDYSFRVVDRAMPADIDDRIRPQRTLMIAFGTVLGLCVSIISILILGSNKRLQLEGPRPPGTTYVHHRHL